MLYTATSDAEGTLGGLVEFGRLESEFDGDHYPIISAAMDEGRDAGSMHNAADRMDRYSGVAERALDQLWDSLRSEALNAMVNRSATAGSLR